MSMSGLTGEVLIVTSLSMREGSSGGDGVWESVGSESVEKGKGSANLGQIPCLLRFER
jgi:hypothetical protein